MHLLYTLIIGGVAGWLAGNILKGQSYGLVVNIILGICGAFIGGFLFGAIGFKTTHVIGQIISATVGAVVIVLVARRFR
ncbi:MAG: GlsB/YeaQ/YmgE family stress response membrane protein [Bacteroidetes bacterium]|nr:MAG: GlsB/YeaQ/YmgE family stress response membrane protein [Bacteroidota bacterium]